MSATLSRRSMVAGFAALMCAPAIVRASSLMPVKAIQPSALALPDGWVIAPAPNGEKIYRVTFKILLEPNSGTGSRKLWTEVIPAKGDA